MDAHQSKHATTDPVRVQQIPLLDLEARPEWFLDETTRVIGRDGVARARAALRAARRHDDLDDPTTHPGLDAREDHTTPNAA